MTAATTSNPNRIDKDGTTGDPILFTRTGRNPPAIPIGSGASNPENQDMEKNLVIGEMMRMAFIGWKRCFPRLPPDGVRPRRHESKLELPIHAFLVGAGLMVSFRR